MRIECKYYNDCPAATAWCRENVYSEDCVVLLMKKFQRAQMPQVHYLCDRRSCDGCNAECEHTIDIRHAKNFELSPCGENIFMEVER